MVGCKFENNNELLYKKKAKSPSDKLSDIFLSSSDTFITSTSCAFSPSQVCVGNDTATGTGCNKKLAKRAAAEKLLQMLGYHKPQPQPGKPVLKSTTSNESTAESTISVSNHTDTQAKGKKVSANNNRQLCLPRYSHL